MKALLPPGLSVVVTDAESRDTIDEGDGTGVYLLVRWPEGVEIRALEDGEELTLGRARDAQIVVPDSRVSRLHARLRLEQGRLAVTDLGSRNGTRVNRHVLLGNERRLFGGDIVQVGPLEVAIARVAAPPSGEGEHAGVVVADPAMRRVYEIAHRLAETRTTVLLLGETGCGKDVVAEQIHRWSPRGAGDLVRLECTRIAEGCLEADLEAADRGTLFLDEVGELLGMQLALLSVLENRRGFDVRLICATNRDLEEDVAARRFREDLYYRINTFTLRIPPLRDRPGEIVLLAYHYARRFGASEVSTEAAAALAAHTWPGNVRELRNAIEHATVLAEGGVIRREHLPEAVRRGIGPELDAEEQESRLLGQLELVERHSIEEALRAERNNQTRAAERLGITRRALIYRMQKLGISR